MCEASDGEDIEPGFNKIPLGFKRNEELAMKAMKDEWDKASKTWDKELETWQATEDDMENIEYVLDKVAGDSDKAFHHGWKRDCDPLTGEVRTDRKDMKLEDFLKNQPDGVDL